MICQNSVRLRMPAEWEDQEAILMAWPHTGTDWAPIIEEARAQFARIAAELARHGDNVVLLATDAAEAGEYLDYWFSEELGDKRGRDRINIVSMEINDTWTRDYGPISVLHDGETLPYAVDFRFNAWGNKFESNLDNAVNAKLCEAGIIDRDRYMDSLDFVLEGGSVESDGRGTILTTSTCLLNPNRNPSCSREKIEHVLAERLGARRILWVNHGHIPGDDTDSHIDTICRLGPGDVLLYSGAGENDDPGADELRKMTDELARFRTDKDKPYHLVELPRPDPIFDDVGNPLAATYANFLVTPKNVYIPSYGRPRTDRLAAMTIQAVYNDRRVVPIDCSVLIRQGGSLHCSTMQLYPGMINLSGSCS